MDDFDGIIIFGVVIIVATLLFVGVTSLLKKSFNTAPKIDKIEIQTLKRTQQQRMDDVKTRQKRLMEDQKRKMQDMRRRSHL